MNLFKYVQKLIEIYNFSLDWLEKKVHSFCDWLYVLYDTYLRPYVEKVLAKIEDFRVKYLGKGQLGDYVLIRYLCKELMLYFGVSFLFFFMIFFVNQILLLIGELLKQRVPFSDAYRLMIYTLPFVISQSAPFSTLVGFLMCLGRIMSDNEVLIIRASGQSYIMIMVPVFILGILISVASFFVNDYLLPIGTIKYNQLYRKILTSNPSVQLEPNSIKFFNKSILITGDVKDTNVSDLIFFDEKGDTQRIIVSGKSNLISAREEGVLMQMNMSDSVVASLDSSKKGDYEVLDASSMTMNIFDSAILNTNTRTTPREMTSFDLGRQVKQMKKMENLDKRILNHYRMEYYKKFSSPFGSIFFAILALPLAFLFGKHNGQTIGLIFGLVICVIYWAMMIIGQMFSIRIGIDAFVAMWLPDTIIGVTGGLLYFTLKRK
ncbi:MAG: LptF/LptG family permease [Treponema sp.]|nr:LptF/LptG family permease [Treponema sp.]